MDFYNKLKSFGKGELEFLQGMAQAFISGKNEYKKVPRKLSIDRALYLEGAFIAKITWGGYYLIYPSLNAQADLFTFGGNGNVEDIGYDFIDLCRKHKPELTLHTQAISFFRRHGLFRPGETYFHEVKRVKIGQGLLYKDGVFQGYVDLPVHTWKRTTTEDYRRGLWNFVKLQTLIQKNNEYLLFSGGRDSALLALLMNKDMGVEAGLVHAIPRGAALPDDTKRNISFYEEFLGQTVATVTYDYNAYTFDDITYICRQMPLAAHISIGFDAMNKFVAKNKGRSWTGQDADSMYSLGYTGGALKEVVARLMESDGSYKSLADVEGRSCFRLCSQALAFAYNLKNKNVKAPVCVEDLRRAFSEMRTSIPLVDAAYKAEPGRILSLQEARHILYRDRMSFYISGRDHRVVAVAGNPVYPTVFPYSSAMMYFLHIGIEKNLGEAVRNKKKISDLICSYIGSKNFRRLYPGELFHTYAAGAQIEKDILNKTVFGRSIREYSGYQGGLLTEAIPLAWEKSVMGMLGFE